MNLDWIASALGARTARRAGRIQSLWGGYGELFRVALDGGRVPGAVIKWARPPANAADDASSRRKRRSFDVETAFYRSLAPRCDDRCRVAELYAARGDDAAGEWLLVLEDLDASGFALRSGEATGSALDAALRWLASFHARFLGEQVAGVWPTGTYWHLGTRRDELDAIEDSTLRAAAGELAGRLEAARFRTLLHGDAKDANFCYSADRTRAAAVDFQYTGHGAGIVDVAYLMYGRADEPADGIDARALARYFALLREAIAARGADVDVDALETEWRALYPIARLDFCRFLAGWRPALWQSDRRGQRFVREQLARTLRP